ncbi:MAG: SpaA isopeptide-forming pilin-related protein [Blautia sp.]|nr:SpaA isopeptide-forming pilin-related protein [Blautia sp.]
MKSDRKKRILAAILCMVMVLSSNISALAEGEVYADPDAVTQMETPEAVSETQPESAPQEPAAEEPPVSTEPAAPEAPAENNEPAAPETPAGNNEPAAPETPAENNEPATPETPETPAEEAPVFSEETELTKELRDASGKLVQKVTAKLPKGAFEAETSQIEMEVTYVDSSMENYIKGMMEKKLPTDNTLGDYFLYNIQFKVNGEAKESLEPITITFEKSNLEIKDTKKANVFFFDPANPEVSGDKDELVEITQRSELLESLQAAGQSTATMEEDYDLSSIEIKEENRSGKIVLEGRKSTIYGCYVEKEPEQKEEASEEKPADIPVLNYEDDKVTVSVTAEEAGIIPEGAELKVLPITSEDTETKEQYQEVEKKIQEKVAEEEKEVAGFLAYDITFVDKDGNEMEPNGKVKVSMNYKKAELPQEVVENKATDAEVTVLHLEEDENGEVKQVVDMGAEQKANVDTLTTTEGAKVQNVEVETERFSVFTITWKFDYADKNLSIRLLDVNGNSITASIPEWNSTNTTSVSEIAKRASIPGYTFQYAVYGEGIDSASGIEQATEVQRIKCEKKDNRYSWKYNKYASEEDYWEKIEKDIYFIYKQDSSSGGGTGGNQESSLGIPAHNKYIKQNELGEDYTLTLDVTGGIGEAKTLDVLFVIDESNSMEDGSGEFVGTWPNRNEKSRAQVAKEAIESFASVIQKSDAMQTGALNLNYAAVAFGSAAYQKKVWTSFPKNGSLNIQVNDDKGGTNWEDGVYQAEQLLKEKATDGNEKVVIFLTDGNPTMDRDNGSGRSYSERYYNSAVNRWNKRSPNLKKSKAYVVDMNMDASDKEENKCSDFATDIGATHIDGTDASALKTGFETIAANIARPAYKNVKIIDSLSQWVELKNGTENTIFTLKRIKNGQENQIISGKLSEVGQYITYSENSKQITVDLRNVSNTHILEDGVKYSVTFDVKPTEAAKQKYLNDGRYPDGNIGDENTDVPGYTEDQYTSSGKPGFFSNEKAYVSYHINNGNEKKADYPKPVVQVKENSTEITITKVNSVGTGLSGAVFKLTKENTTNVLEQTSGENGTLTFTGLTDGKYVLEEVSAPSGYERPAETWKVIVVTVNKVTTATLYKADGTTPVENNKIVNYTETEIAEKNLKSSKTATVVDEDERIFQIDLSAATSGQEAGQAAKGASIVLALDASSSMGKSGMDAIKAAAKKFVDTTFNASKISEIAIVWYQGTEGSWDTTTKVNAFKTLHDKSAVQNVKDFIDEGSHEGGTPMGDAMKATYDLLKEAQNTNKYVIFFTDGMPGHSDSNSFNCMVANKAYNYANKIKDANDENAIIYTVGYNLSGSFLWQPGHSADTQYAHNDHYTNTTATNFLSDYIATTGKSFTVDKADKLNGIFDDIAGEIGALFTIQPEKIVDVIDARFELTDASKAALEEAGAYIISNTDGTTTIEWTGEKATIGNENAGTDGSVKGPWSASFQIKAKDDFIGGNMIPTNGAESGIYLDDENTRYFEQPSVNVKLLSLSMENKESWYYKGDTIEPAGFMNELDETLKIHQLNNQVTDTGNPILSELTEEQKTELVKNGTLVVNAYGDVETLKYVYPNTSDAVGYFRYKYETVKDSEENPLGNMESHVAEKVGENVEQYKLTVEFIPYSVDERDATLGDAIKTPATNGGAELNPQTDKLTAEGIYSVNVVAGEIQITKKLEETSEEDQTFSFVVTKDGEEFKTIDITIPAGKEQATYFDEELRNLSRGNYKIVESKATGYGVKEIILTNKVDEKGSPTAYETDCKSTLDSLKSVEFVLGKDKNDSNVIQNGEYEENGVFGGVLFTNEEIISDWRIVKRSATNHNNFLSGAEFQLSNNERSYYGKSNENGLVEWYNDADFSCEKVEKFEKGSYTLKETKAPNLYAVSDEEWTVEITHDGDLKTIQNKEGKKLQGELDADGKTYKYYFDNVMLYELPSTGGPGIFVYTIGGTLLLMAAALLIYKMKREEVLKG